MFSTDAKSAFTGRSLIYRISLNGGVSELLPFGVGITLLSDLRKKFFSVKHAWSGKMEKIQRRNSRYSGLTEEEKGSLKNLSGTSEKSCQPMWIKDRIYFICDHEGIGKALFMQSERNDIRVIQITKSIMFVMLQPTAKNCLPCGRGNFLCLTLKQTKKRKLNRIQQSSDSVAEKIRWYRKVFTGLQYQPGRSVHDCYFKENLFSFLTGKDMQCR